MAVRARSSVREAMYTTAPRRDFGEHPSLVLQDNMLYVVAGGLHGDVSDQSRNLYVTVINILTGMVHAVCSNIFLP